MEYKTIRISYSDKTDSYTDVAKYFEVVEEKDPDLSGEIKGETGEIDIAAVEITPDLQLTGEHLAAKFPNCYGYFITDTLVDFLVPIEFDVSQLGGTIIKSDGGDPIHEWLGHKQTPMVVDKQDTREIPVKITDSVKDPIEEEKTAIK